MPQFHSLTAQAAGFAPARGFPPSQVIPATIVAVLITAGVVLGVVRYRQGRFAALERLADRAERSTGLPRWASLPIGMTTRQPADRGLRVLLGRRLAHRQGP